MGLSIIGGGLEVMSGALAMSVFGGIYSCMRRWSEFKCIFWFVVEMYWLLLGVFMKKLSINLLCV